MSRNQESIRIALDIFQEYSMIIQDEYGYKIKNWNKYQNLQEKGIKQFKESTEKSKNVETEREKEVKEEIKLHEECNEVEMAKNKEEIKIEKGGEENAREGPRKFKNYI